MHAYAQPVGRMPRIGLIVVPPLPNPMARAFERGLQELGYLPGRNIDIELRSLEGRLERLPAIASELARLQPDVIVAGGGAPSARAVMNTTATIPIVFPASGDPVGEGLIKSLARPGGNVTGLSILSVELSAKRVQLLRDLVSRLSHLAVLQDHSMRTTLDQVSATEKAAAALGMKLEVLSVESAEQYEAAFQAASKAGAEALIVLPSSLFNANRRRLIDLAEKYRLPTLWEHRLFTESGGLVSYGTDIPDLYRRAAGYVDRILKGAKPAEMPVERATKLEFVINLKTAKALGIVASPTLLARADDVIQ
jgi:putative ABC transport system substrate-binding protein